MRNYKKIPITQSAIKNLRAVDKYGNPSYCDLKWINVYRDKNESNVDKIPITWLMGLVFEQEVIGSNRSGVRVEMPPTRAGAESANERKLKLAIQKAKENFEHHGIVLLMVQPELLYKDEDDWLYEAHIDAVFMFRKDLPDCWKDIDFMKKWPKEEEAFAEIKRAYVEEGVKVSLMDVKFTDTRMDDAWNGWADPEEKLNRDGIQVKFYCYLWFKVFGYYPPFLYYVHGQSDKRHAENFYARVSESAMANLVVRINLHKSKVKNITPKGIGRYNICEWCEYNDECPSRTRVPEIVEIKIVE